MEVKVDFTSEEIFKILEQVAFDKTNLKNGKYLTAHKGKYDVKSERLKGWTVEFSEPE